MKDWPPVIKFVLYAASTSLSAVVLVVTGAFVWMMIDPQVANAPIYAIIGPAFQDTVIAFIGLVAAVGGFIAGDKNKADREDGPPS